MATALLRTPRSKAGCVVECGTYKGGSATNLSLICRITGRKLHIFDSFEGVSAPSKLDGFRTHSWMWVSREIQLPSQTRLLPSFGT